MDKSNVAESEAAYLAAIDAAANADLAAGLAANNMLEAAIAASELQKLAATAESFVRSAAARHLNRGAARRLGFAELKDLAAVEARTSIYGTANDPVARATVSLSLGAAEAARGKKAEAFRAFKNALMFAMDAFADPAACCRGEATSDRQRSQVAVHAATQLR